MTVRLEISRGGLFALLIGWSALTVGTTGILIEYAFAQGGRALVGSILVATLGLILLSLAVFGFVRESRTA